MHASHVPGTTKQTSPRAIPPRRPRRTGLVATTLLASLLACLGCSQQTETRFQGYLEADYVHVAAPVPGILLERPVHRGVAVSPGTRLFTLEATAENATLTEAEQRLAQSRAHLENLRKGRRPSEIATLEARLKQAIASRQLSEIDFARREQLFREDVTAQSELDLARSRRDADRAAVSALEAELETARLGAREDEIRAAESETAAAEAAARRARWSVDQKTQSARIHALVHETLFEPGEFVTAGQPVVTLLPPENLILRFYIPQSELPRAQPGAKILVHLDGLPTPLTGVVRTTSTRAEFTPPVIFSRETRQKLVFRVEATLEGPPNPALRPGQPVDITWTPNAPSPASP